MRSSRTKRVRRSAFAWTSRPGTRLRTTWPRRSGRGRRNGPARSRCSRTPSAPATRSFASTSAPVVRVRRGRRPRPCRPGPIRRPRSRDGRFPEVDRPGTIAEAQWRSEAVTSRPTGVEGEPSGWAAIRAGLRGIAALGLDAVDPARIDAVLRRLRPGRDPGRAQTDPCLVRAESVHGELVPGRALPGSTACGAPRPAGRPGGTQTPPDSLRARLHRRHRPHGTRPDRAGLHRLSIRGAFSS